MTLVVGLHLGTYALVAADSRATYFFPDGSETVDDEYKKVHFTNTGVVAGAGLLPVTEWIIERMKALPKLSPFELQAAMHARTSAIAARLPDDHRVRLAGARTGWIVLARRSSQVELEFYQSDLNFDGRRLTAGWPASLLPWDAGMKVFEPRLHDLKSKLKPLKNMKDLDSSLDYHLEVVSEFMRNARAVSTILGPSMQVGYCTESGETEVTDLIPID